MLLEGKTAIVLGVSGHIGRHVAERFLREGAIVFGAGRNGAHAPIVEKLADYRDLDATDTSAVTDFVDAVWDRQGRIDVVVNLAGARPTDYHHGKPSVEVSSEQFLLPLSIDTCAQFTSAKAAYPHMARQGFGTVIFNTSTLAKVGAPWSAAASASHAATEGLMRVLAHEWGPTGIRVLGVRSEAMPESPTIDYTFKTMGRQIGLDYAGMKDFVEQNKTALKRLPSAEDTAGVFAFAASDLAACMAGTMLNQSAGHILE